MKPTITGYGRDTLLLLGETLVASCQSSGFPAPVVNWNWKDIGRAIQGAIVETNATSANNTMSVNLTAEVDHRVLQCTATNKITQRQLFTEMTIRVAGGNGVANNPDCEIEINVPYRSTESVDCNEERY